MNIHTDTYIFSFLLFSFFLFFFSLFFLSFLFLSPIFCFSSHFFCFPKAYGSEGPAGDAALSVNVGAERLRSATSFLTPSQPPSAPDKVVIVEGRFLFS